MRTWILPLTLGLALPLAASVALVGCDNNSGTDGEQNCVDEVDNDQDGLTDCADDDCAPTLACSDTDTGDTGDTDDTDTGDESYPTLATAAATFYGEDKEDWAGFSIAGNVDINGDGENDLLIGAPQHDCEDINGNTVTDSGAAYVVFGPVSGTMDLGDADVKICGDGNDNLLGYAVAMAADITGDGLGDVIVSAPRAGSGRIYILSGLVASATPVYLDETTITSQLRGEGAEDHFGYSLSVGFIDSNRANATLAVGADAFGDPRVGSVNVGRTYLVTAPLPSDLAVSRAPAWFTGEQDNETSGRDMAMGDFNGDGTGDFALGAVRASGDVSRSGRVYVKYAPIGDTRFDVTDADLILSGAQEEANVGQVVNNAGDINDDGVDDLLVGAHTAGGISENGAAYLFFGSYDGWEDKTTGQADLILNGVTAYDRLGHGATGVGDVTADGIDDLAIGALTAELNSISNSGATYIMAGGTAVTGSYDVEDVAYTAYAGNLNEEQSGHRVARGGDLTADDRDDIIIGAYTNRTNGDKAGAVYVIASPFTER